MEGHKPSPLSQCSRSQRINLFCAPYWAAPTHFTLFSSWPQQLRNSIDSNQLSLFTAPDDKQISHFCFTDFASSLSRSWSQGHSWLTDAWILSRWSLEAQKQFDKAGCSRQALGVFSQLPSHLFFATHSKDTSNQVEQSCGSNEIKCKKFII